MYGADDPHTIEYQIYRGEATRSSHLARALECTARPRTRGASRRRQPLGVAKAGRLKARLVDRGALATR